MITGDDVLTCSRILMGVGGIICIYGVLTDDKRRKNGNKKIIRAGTFTTIIAFIITFVPEFVILQRIIDQNYVGLVTFFILQALIFVFLFLVLFFMNKVKKIEEV